MNFYNFKERILDGETIYFELSIPEPEYPNWYRAIYEEYGDEIIKADSSVILQYDSSDLTVLINADNHYVWLPVDMMNDVTSFCVDISLMDDLIKIIS